MKEQTFIARRVACAVLVLHSAVALLAQSPQPLSFLRARTDYPQQVPTGVVLADFNGDGTLDMAAPNIGGTVAVWFGNGDGTFQPGPSSAVCPQSSCIGVSGVILGDFNGDGKPDLAFPDQNAHMILVVLGNGDGTFSQVPPVPIPSEALTISSGDFNGDGKLDLAVLLGTGPITILLGNGDGTFTVGSTTNDEDGPEAIRRCGF
jgi:hypothetical protein